MDYEFRRDITGQILAYFSMGHEVIGYWLNEEIKCDLSLIEQIEQHAQRIANSGSEWSLNGREYTLSIADNDASVRANQLDFHNEELEEDMHYYDEESLAFCGVTDLLSMLDRYRHFILESR